MSLLLSNLAADIIFSIFRYSDICSVVSTGQTCRYLYSLAFCKTVWLDLLYPMGIPDLQNLDIEDLLKLAKRLVTGPETWIRNPPSSQFLPEVSKEIVLHPRFNSGEHPAFNKSELLPSGRNLLFKTSKVLECWDVEQDTLLWRHTSVLASSPHFSVIRFAAEELNAGDALVVMVCARCDDIIGQMSRFVEIVKVDLRERTHYPLLFARVPSDGLSFSNPVICGTLAAVRTTDDTYFIADWQAQTYFTLTCCPDSPSQVVLIPGHVILKVAVSQGGHEMHVVSHDALLTHLIPVVGLEGEGASEFNTVSSHELTKLSTLSSETVQHSFVHMSVLPSPTHQDEYRIWIYGCNLSKRPLPRYGLWCYQLSMPVGQPSRWRQRAVYPAWKEASYISTTYSGHALMSGNPQRWIVPPTQTPEVGEVDLAGLTAEIVDLTPVPYVHISPYSGALTYSTDNTIVIRWFK
ncbi:F-box domain-containing protein [Mycena sanguinolenta]|uniref:F-box domain-containing protein n=1 Tax=Mycena sanguinolenta TaxID=230812 RepID=A0A8H7DLB7_9AGAR|nr:F-box domain-containing protein [Mycena sanguinolenta]